MANPAREPSRWFCDRAGCDGAPHGPLWHWCDHPVDGTHDKSCRHARAAQRPPDGDWFVWLLLSGRGFGKSRAAAEWIVDQARNAEPGEWAVLARSAEDVRKNAEDMDAGLVKVAGPHLRQYNRSLMRLTLDNGSVIHLLSADKPDRLRGYNLMGAWCDELASWRYPDTWHMTLLPALRESKGEPRVVVTTTPRPVKLLKELMDGVSTGATVVTTGSTFDNAANLAPRFITEMRERYDGTRVGRQELQGELLFDSPGAVVSQDMINGARLRPEDFKTDKRDTLVRIVVAVDPATTYGEKADETGIIVCGKDGDGHGYVLDDLSCRTSPRRWAKTVVNAYERWHADRIVTEENQGGKAWEAIFRAENPTVAYTGTRAKVGKRLRAEPITALYEQGRIHHVGSFNELEDQLTSWEPDSGLSPDRLDALVHGFTELGLARWGQGAGFLRYWQRDVEAGRDPLAAAERDARVRSRAAKGVEVRERVRRQMCEHRWRVDPAGRRCCVFCGAA